MFRAKCIAPLIFAVAVATSSEAARACDGFPGTDFRPTNFELVRIAREIVVASPVAEIRMSNNRPDAVKFRVDEVIKGPPLRSFVKDQTGFGPIRGRGPVARSDPHMLFEPHPESYDGGCNRMTFDPRGSYVVFLGPTFRGRHLLFWQPYSRVSEDYDGEQSLWMQTIREYLYIQKTYPPAQWKAALRVLLRRKQSEPQTPDLRAQERDIEEYLHAPKKPALE